MAMATVKMSFGSGISNELGDVGIRPFLIWYILAAITSDAMRLQQAPFFARSDYIYEKKLFFFYNFFGFYLNFQELFFWNDPTKTRERKQFVCEHPMMVIPIGVPQKAIDLWEAMIGLEKLSLVSDCAKEFEIFFKKDH